MHTLASVSKFNASFRKKMTDSTIKKKSQYFWGEDGTNAMLDILREMDINEFLENWKIKTQTVKW